MSCISPFHHPLLKWWNTRSCFRRTQWLFLQEKIVLYNMVVCLLLLRHYMDCTLWSSNRSLKDLWGIWKVGTNENCQQWWILNSLIKAIEANQQYTLQSHLATKQYAPIIYRYIHRPVSAAMEPFAGTITTDFTSTSAGRSCIVIERSFQCYSSAVWNTFLSLTKLLL